MLRRCLLAAVLLACACSKPAAKAPARATGASAAAERTSSSTDSWESLPARDAYAGSATCKECHEKNHTRWSHDWHARALQQAERGNVVGRFDGSHFKGESSEAWMEHQGSRFLMRTRDRSGQLHDYPVAWVIGGKRMQDAATIFDDGRWQVLPVYYHVTGGGAWVDYNGSKQGKVGPDHPYFWTNFRRTSNKECLDCHATGLDVRYDRLTRKWSTSFADAGVACEACHGPGARHAETKDKHDIIHPGHVDKATGLSICARCHGPREPLFPFLDAKDQFRPGQQYDDRYQALVVVDGLERSGEYFADGRPSSSSFEYQALLQSRCYRLGGATCLTCHTAPHEDHVADEIKDDPDHACRQCHAAVVAQGEKHTHHRTAKGASCNGCHMPRLVSGVLDKFPDHTIDIPNVTNTLRHGVPNACAVCHPDMSAAKANELVTSWWPNAAARTARRSLLADAIDEKTAGTSLPALTAVVRDPAEAPTLRGAAAVLLGQRFAPSAAAILGPLLHDRSPVVRARFLEALGYARAYAAADAVAAFTNDPSIQTRQTAALVLSSLNDPRGQAAVEKLANDPATRALVRPHIVLGIAAANHGDVATAERELGFVISEAPYAVDSLVFLADLDARRGDLTAARAELENALSFDPSHRGALKRLQAMGR